MDEHYRENPSNHELLTVRGVDRRLVKNVPGPNHSLLSMSIVDHCLHVCYIEFAGNAGHANNTMERLCALVEVNILSQNSLICTF